MQEEVTQKTIALVFKSSRLTADVLKKAMIRLVLFHSKLYVVFLCHSLKGLDVVIRHLYARSAHGSS